MTANMKVGGVTYSNSSSATGGGSGGSGASMSNSGGGSGAATVSAILSAAAAGAAAAAPLLGKDGKPLPSAALAAMPDRLNEMWKQQHIEVDKLDVTSKNDFKHHNDLPLARIKRIMKSDEDVRMISAEAPILFAKACEQFILDLSVRSWCYSEHNKRTGLEKEDIFAVLQNTDVFDFLAEAVINNPEPRERPPGT
jgi:nuclear transcription factor Y gamma